MAAANWFRYTYLAHLSRPKAVRHLYRLVSRSCASRIVEVGISDLKRAIAMIEVAQRACVDKPINYTAIDWFESRPSSGSALPLKEAYRQLRATGANVRLVPGAPGAALSAAANAHQHTDLILIGPEVTDADMKRAWFFVPRMLHADSTVLREHRDSSGQPVFSSVSRTQIAEWASCDATRRAA